MLTLLWLEPLVSHFWTLAYWFIFWIHSPSRKVDLLIVRDSENTFSHFSQALLVFSLHTKELRVIILVSLFYFSDFADSDITSDSEATDLFDQVFTSRLTWGTRCSSKASWKAPHACFPLRLASTIMSSFDVLFHEVFTLSSSSDDVFPAQVFWAFWRSRLQTFFASHQSRP